MELQDLSKVTDFLTVIHATKMTMPRITLLCILREIELKEMSGKGLSLSKVPFTPVGELEARYREKTRQFAAPYRYESMRSMCHILWKYGFLKKSREGQYVEYRLAKLGRQYMYLVSDCVERKNANE